MYCTQVSEAVSACLIGTHDLHSFTDGCFHIIILCCRQEFHQNRLHVVLFEVWTVGYTQPGHHLHAHKTQTAVIITLTVKHSLKDISSVIFTILSHPDDTFNCTEMDFRFGGRQNEFYQPLQASVLVDLLYTLAVTQAVGKYLQGLNVEVSEVLHRQE